MERKRAPRRDQRKPPSTIHFRSTGWATSTNFAQRGQCNGRGPVTRYMVTRMTRCRHEPAAGLKGVPGNSMPLTSVTLASFASRIIARNNSVTLFPRQRLATPTLKTKHWNFFSGSNRKSMRKNHLNRGTILQNVQFDLLHCTIRCDCNFNFSYFFRPSWIYNATGSLRKLFRWNNKRFSQ